MNKKSINHYNKNTVEKNGIFKYISSSTYNIPKYGWKIHISANKNNRSKILNIVMKYCINNKIAFKYIKEIKDFNDNINFDANSKISGKFITIYPKNQRHANIVLIDLNKLLNGQTGPLVLSDFIYKQSNNIFFRYGINIINQSSTNPYLILGPNNEKYIDKETNYPRIPSWIKIPTNWIESNNNSYLTNNYKPYAILKKSNSGNVYIGKRINNNKEVIIKEARKNIYKFDDFLQTTLKENEWKLSQKINQTESPLDKINNKFSVFYIYQKNDGITLTKYNSSKNTFLLNYKNHNLNFKKIKLIIINIMNLVESLKKHGYQNIDIHSSNIIINKDCSVSLIDLETINIQNIQLKTPGYWFKNMKYEKINIQDMRRLGLLILYIFGELNLYSNIIKNKEMIYITKKKLSNIGKISNLNKLLNYLLNSHHPEIVKAKEIAKKLKFNMKRSSNTKNLKSFHYPRYKINDTLKYVLNQYSITFINQYNPILKAIINMDKNNNMHSSNYEHLNDLKLNDINIKSLDTGINGIGGLIILCSINIKKYKNIINKCISELNNRAIKHKDKDYWVMNHSNLIINPYPLRGIAGALLGISTLPTIMYPKNIKSIIKSLNNPMGKSPNYINGMLGISDAIMTISLRIQNNILFNIGIDLFNSANDFIIKNKGKEFLPSLLKNDLINLESGGIDTLNFIKIKWSL